MYTFTLFIQTPPHPGDSDISFVLLNPVPTWLSQINKNKKNGLCGVSLSPQTRWGSVSTENGSLDIF